MENGLEPVKLPPDAWKGWLRCALQIMIRSIGLVLPMIWVVGVAICLLMVAATSLKMGVTGLSMVAIPALCLFVSLVILLAETEDAPVIANIVNAIRAEFKIGWDSGFMMGAIHVGMVAIIFDVLFFLLWWFGGKPESIAKEGVDAFFRSYAGNWTIVLVWQAIGQPFLYLGSTRLPKSVVDKGVLLNRNSLRVVLAIELVCSIVLITWFPIIAVPVHFFFIAVNYCAFREIFMGKGSNKEWKKASIPSGVIKNSPA